MGKELASAAHAALNLVEDQLDAVRVAQIAQTLEALIGQRADPALALHRLDQDGGDIRFSGGGIQRLVVAPGEVNKTWQQGAEAFGHLFRACGGDTGSRAAMERAFEGDDLDPLEVALFIMILARHLDGEFASLCAGIGEKDGIGEGRVHQLVGQRLLGRYLVEVGGVPKVLRLFGQGLDQFRIGMAQRIDRDPRTEIKKPSPVGLDQPRADPFNESQRSTVIGRQERGDHHVVLVGQAR